MTKDELTKLAQLRDRVMSGAAAINDHMMTVVESMVQAGGSEEEFFSAATTWYVRMLEAVCEGQAPAVLRGIAKELERERSGCGKWPACLLGAVGFTSKGGDA